MKKIVLPRREQAKGVYYGAIFEVKKEIPVHKILQPASSPREGVHMCCPVPFYSFSRNSISVTWFRISALLCVVWLGCAVARAGDITIPKQFPIQGNTGQSNLSPPHLYQTNECATKVGVDSFVPHATIKVFLVAPPPKLHKLIGGPVDPFFGHDAIPLTQTLHTNDEIEATQTVNGVTSAYSAPMKVGAMPNTLHDPDVLPPFYACGQIVPVNGLVSGVKLEVQDSTTGSVIGTDTIPSFYSSDGWDPPTVSPLDAPPKVSPAHEVSAKQEACTGVHSNFGPAKKIDPQPSGCHPPKVEKPIIGNDAVTLDDLYTGALVQVTDSGMPVASGLAVGASDSAGLSHKITSASSIVATQKLCTGCGMSKPATPSDNIPAPTLVWPICEKQTAAFVQNSTVNATLVLLHGTDVIGYGGAAPYEVPIDLAPPNVFSTGEVVQVAEYIGSNIVFSNTVTVGCDLQVRMRWQDFISGPDGAKRLASLIKAFKKMKSLDSSPPTSADYRRSWAYWANIHGYYGYSISGSPNPGPDGTVEDHISYINSMGLSSDDSYYSTITDQTPPDSIASAIWATCQHSAGPTPATGQALNFFGWHRMWLYYLERVMRWAAGDNTLRLPYWDYTNPSQLELPAEFQNTASELYDALRDPNINSGSETLDSTKTDVDSYLMETDYFTYEYGIETGVHSHVHCTVGPQCPVAHMGDVPVAGNDPIFPEHHANIDRLWACWQYLHGTPAGSWQSQSFSFVDETGTEVTKPVSDFIDSIPLGYVYDNYTDCMRQPPMMMMRRAQRAEQPMAGAENKTTVLGSVKTIPITRPQASAEISVSPAELERLLAQPEGAVTAFLVLQHVTAQGPPGVLFDVYIAPKGDPGARKYAGTMSWFGAFDHRHEKGQMSGTGVNGPMDRTFQFPVTQQMRQLGGRSELTISFEATTGRVPVDKSKLEEEKQKAAKDFLPQSKLEVGAIELQATYSAGQEKR
jgi:Common central domain of tyrosinase